MRGNGYRPMAAADQDQTQALLDLACRARSLGQALAHGARIPMAGSTAITAAGGTRSDGLAGLKTWGYLRTYPFFPFASPSAHIVGAEAKRIKHNILIQRESS